MFTLGPTPQICKTMRSDGWVNQVKLTHIAGLETTCKGMFTILKSEEDTLGTETNNAELHVPHTTFKNL